MRQTLLLVRIQHDLHQHSGEKPPTQPIILKYGDGKEIIIDLPTSQTPVITPLPIFEYPGILTNAHPDQTGSVLLNVFEEDGRDEKWRRLFLVFPKAATASVRSSPIRVTTFYRWLAKVAYAYAVACLGYEEIKHSPLAEIVRSGGTHYNYYIGGNNAYQPPSQEFRLEAPSPELFRISLADQVTNDGKKYWVANIRFLPKLSFPTYIVVVGEKR